MTRDEFEVAYVKRSQVHYPDLTLDKLHETGRAARPCACGEEGCQGWQMVNVQDYEEEVAAWKRGDGPHPSGGEPTRETP
jgi:hypothetical protein